MVIVINPDKEIVVIAYHESCDKFAIKKVSVEMDEEEKRFLSFLSRLEMFITRDKKEVTIRYKKDKCITEKDELILERIVEKIKKKAKLC